MTRGQIHRWLGALDWKIVTRSLAQPYRVPASMIVLFALVPLYVLIPEFFPPRARHVPALALDHLLPLVPSWGLVYGALYVFLILLPVFVVRQDELLRLTVNAYLLIWLTAYACFFVAYPTVAPRPSRVTGEGFAVWGLRVLYAADPPYNCFPSLHVAHSYVSAFACARVHRQVGLLAMVLATLVAISTLFTKQHYVLDVISGVFLASIAYALFLRPYSSHTSDESDRRAAPLFALCVALLVVVGLAASWLVYVWGGQTHFSFAP